MSVVVKEDKMTEEEKQQLEEFKEELFTKHGEYFSKLILNMSSRKEILKTIEYASGKGFDMETIVNMVINYHIPPQFTVTVDLLGTFKSPNHIRHRIVQIVNEINNIENININHMAANSLVPYLQELFVVDCHNDECEVHGGGKSSKNRTKDKVKKERKLKAKQDKEFNDFMKQIYGEKD